ncbi:MAG: energy transducer TonB [Bradyrhizobiaceae bacterium]|nr:MAG: energy transducer TonB [Bradyrhizobiaceae bacterium]
MLSSIWKDPAKRLWLYAAIAAVVLHVGSVALAVTGLSSDEADEALGAAGLEIDVQLAAPRAEPTDLPPGPDTEASAASPPVVQQKEVLKKTDLPQDKPVESDDPDRVVSENNTKNPTEEDPKVAAKQSVQSTESVAAEATAMPTSEVAQQSERSTTLAQGTGDSKQRIRTTWQKELVAHLDRHKRYPSDRSQINAEITVNFVIDRTGHILSSTIVKGSGDPSFDAAALSMLQRSDPVPPPPPVLADEGLSFTLPVVFRAKHG